MPDPIVWTNSTCSAGEVRGPGPVPLRGGRVVAVVAGQVQVAQVHAGIPAVQLDLAERDLGGARGAGQLRLVVPVGQWRVGAGGAGQLKRFHTAMLDLGSPPLGLLGTALERG